MTFVADIVKRLHKFAPTGYAENWDNVGLQIGDPSAPVNRILLTLDVTPTAIRKAVATSCDMIVAHHPLIFRPLRAITDPNLLELARRGIAVLCAHTNLDSARGGVNYALAEALRLSSPEVLSPAGEWLHIAVYTPEEAVKRVAEAVFEAGAGWIGNYSHCLNRTLVLGQFQGENGAHPTVGKTGSVESLDECKLEFFCEAARLNEVIAAMRQAHPYETPAYAVYPQKTPSPNVGMGVVGRLPEPMTLQAFSEAVKTRLDAPFVRLWTAGRNPEQIVSRVAVCGGSGGSFLNQAQSRADVFVTGDVTYHTFLDSRIPIIDAGHFHTEYPVLKVLREVVASPDIVFETLLPAEHEIRQLSVF